MPERPQALFRLIQVTRTQAHKCARVHTHVQHARALQQTPDGITCKVLGGLQRRMGRLSLTVRAFAPFKGMHKLSEWK